MDQKEVFEQAKYVCKLAQTAEYHELIGSTLPEDDPLIKNSGKRRVDLMTDEEVEAFLDREKTLIAEYIERAKGDKLGERLLKDLEEDWELSLPFLDFIGRLPDKYRDELKTLKAKTPKTIDSET